MDLWSDTITIVLIIVNASLRSVLVCIEIPGKYQSGFYCFQKQWEQSGRLDMLVFNYCLIKCFLRLLSLFFSWVTPVTNECGALWLTHLGEHLMCTLSWGRGWIGEREQVMERSLSRRDDKGFPGQELLDVLLAMRERWGEIQLMPFFCDCRCRLMRLCLNWDSVKGEEKNCGRRENGPFLPPYLFPAGELRAGHGHSAWRREAKKLRKSKTRGTHRCRLVRTWSETFLSPLPCVCTGKCHVQAMFPATPLSVGVRLFLSFCKSSLENAQTLLGFWEAQWFVFTEKLLPSLPESAEFPGGTFLPQRSWCLQAGDALSLMPWAAAAAVAFLRRSLPWGIISRVEAFCFPRNRKRRRGWEMGGLNNLELDCGVSWVTSAPFSLPTHLLSHGISVWAAGDLMTSLMPWQFLRASLAPKEKPTSARLGGL